MRLRTVTAIGIGCACAPLLGADTPVAVEDVPGRFVVEKSARGDLNLPTPFANVTSAYDANRSLVLEFNEDATSIKVLAGAAGSASRITLDTAEKTTQYADGTIVFSALDARIDGQTAKLESHPGNHRIGFWSNPKDTVSWDCKATRPGMYSAELTYSLASGESEAAFDYAGSAVKSTLKETGSWYRYATVPLGTFYVEKAGKQKLAVRPISKSGGAVMNLKAVTLRPAPEGKPVVIGEDGSIELDSGCATAHGTLLQYERNPKKLCLGYWAKANEWASWDFEVKSAGKYRVELTQGCGKGHGGSNVEVRVGDQTFEFVVDDTGGFQNWKVRNLGVADFKTSGSQRIEVRPKTKPGVAVMDIRRIRLVPVP